MRTVVPPSPFGTLTVMGGMLILGTSQSAVLLWLLVILMLEYLIEFVVMIGRLRVIVVVCVTKAVVIVPLLVTLLIAPY